MLFSSRLTALGGAFLALNSIEGAQGLQNLRQAASVSYQAGSNCPELCTVSGPIATNWTAYHSKDELALCQETVFYYASLHDDVDDANTSNRFFACTSYSAPQPASITQVATKVAQTLNNAEFSFGAWNESHVAQNFTMSQLSMQMRAMLGAYQPSNNTALILFAQTTSGTAGLYVGKNVVIASTVPAALSSFENAVQSSDVSIGGSAAIQLCGSKSGYDGDHVFGFIATSNYSFAPVQQALRTWANATCLDFDTSLKVVGQAIFTTPLVIASNATLNGTLSTNSTLSVKSLGRRGDCTTVSVASGDGCGSLATKCGISPSDFTKYNSGDSFCSSLTPNQHVCCSAGTLPDFSPPKNSDGSCSTYTIVANDNCANLASKYSLTNDKIESFNKDTWAWNGCALLYVGNVICLSEGSAPMPAPLANTLCGPQLPGTVTPPAGTNVSTLNPCPLNACCDVWGQCGVTPEFCTNTNTGAPGTAKPGTNGCISNCGTEIVKTGGPSSPINLAYYEAFGMDRPCLYQDVSQIDESKFSHIHFAFGTMDADYVVSIGDDQATYQFNRFKRMSGVHRVLSFGGWAFSTESATYNIFRTGVTAANRLKMATNLANFIKDNGLDGIDIDWEYPGEPDIPGIPAGSKDDGTNYLAFLAVLKNLLPGKTVSIAAPASYWYLKAFPIAKIAKVIDYVVYMTYDLHGQWDVGSKWAQEGCDGGNCLRSHVNLTETMNSLAMVTKAGVPSGKVVVGVSSYGRSFDMASAGCHGPLCTFTGSASSSNAAKGPCTGTAGYISDAEINDIVVNHPDRINENFIDDTSNSRIVVYDDTQYVAFMDPTILSQRKALYSGLQMGGTTNWASDLETYNDPPEGVDSWSNFKLQIKTGTDPYQHGSRTGNWTTLTCDDASVANTDLSPYERWQDSDAPDAWADIIKTWKDIDKGKGWSFTHSVANTLHGATDGVDCGVTTSNSNCHQTQPCKNFEGGGSGAAAYNIWNSFVMINEMYTDYDTALSTAAARTIGPALPHFELTFAPTKPKKDSLWLSVLLTVITMVGTVAVSAYFNTVLKGLPSFTKTDGDKIAYDNYKDTAKALVSFSTSIAGDFTGDKDTDGWSIGAQAAFSDYLGNAVTAWGNISDTALKRMFDGSDDHINVLTSLINKGQMIGTSGDVGTQASSSKTLTDISQNIAKAFFGYAVTSVWPISEHYAFILDTGDPCGTMPSTLTAVTDDTAKVTGSCYLGRQYFLVMAWGDAKTCSESCNGSHCDKTCHDSAFTMPPGVDHLDGSDWGGLKLDDIVTGSMKTYIQNKGNGGKPTDPTDTGSLTDLMNFDITTPGFMRLPVCSPDMAHAAWNLVTDQTTPNWPCVVKPSKNDCGALAGTFVGQTTDASPSVSDCQQIVKNIQGTQGEWEVEAAVGKEHQIVQYGTCKFGVKGKTGQRNVDFHVGAQDIIDIINSSITQFQSNGKVASKGHMKCAGNSVKEDVDWDLYA